MKAVSRLRRRARVERTRSAFVAEVSRLLATSIDYETTLATVAGLALPELGAWCIVDVVEEDGAVRRLSVVHPDPGKQRLARRLVDCWPPEREDPIGVPLVLRTRVPEVIPEVTDDFLMKVARSEEALRILRALGIGSVMVLPLVARDHVLGAMSFIASSPRHRHSSETFELAQDMAARCAMAIDNARLHRDAQRARHEAELAGRAKSQFLAMTSHEIRTPINAIIGYSQILEMGIPGPLTDKQREHLERIHASSMHLLGLVNEVLDLAKVESGQIKMHKEPAKLSEAVRTSIEIVHSQISQRGLRLIRECDPGGSTGYIGDPDRTRQIVMNLLANACKFTEPGGTIRVRCGITGELPLEARISGVGPWAYAAVEDSGIGIAPEHQRRIFDPFVQVSEGKTRTRDGSGLGLALSRQFARLMGGDLTVSSVPGQGSTFTLWLPAVRENEPLRENGRPPPTRPRGLETIAKAVLERIDPILEEYTARLRADPTLLAGELGDARVRNHLAGLLCEAAQLLLLAEEQSDLASEVLRDGSRIQNLIAEIHGAQRRKLGWSEEALRRDFGVLRAVIREEAEAANAGEQDLEGALEILDRILEQAERISQRSWRRAQVEA
jgi:signal transduction histidine kinase